MWECRWCVLTGVFCVCKTLTNYFIWHCVITVHVRLHCLFWKPWVVKVAMAEATVAEGTKRVPTSGPVWLFRHLCWRSSHAVLSSHELLRWRRVCLPCWREAFATKSLWVRNCPEVHSIAALLLHMQLLAPVTAQHHQVIMDVMNKEQAKIAEEAGACAVMALERILAFQRVDSQSCLVKASSRVKPWIAMRKHRKSHTLLTSEASQQTSARARCDSLDASRERVVSSNSSVKPTSFVKRETGERLSVQKYLRINPLQGVARMSDPKMIKAGCMTVLPGSSWVKIPNRIQCLFYQEIVNAVSIPVWSSALLGTVNRSDKVSCEIQAMWCLTNCEGYGKVPHWTLRGISGKAKCQSGQSVKHRLSIQ